MPANILLLHLSMGAGLIRASEALEAALREAAPDANVQNVDLQTMDGAWLFKRTIAHTLALAETKPHIIAERYERADRRAPGGPRSKFQRILKWPTGKRRRLELHLLVRPMEKLIRSAPWDCIVNFGTISGPIAAQACRRQKLRIPNYMANTDYMAHATMKRKCYHHYFAATSEAAAYLSALGAKKRNIQVTGIPIHPDFAIKQERQSCLNAWGLEGKRPLVVFIAAGFGKGTTSVPGGARMFSHLLKTRVPLEIAVVTGHNTALEAVLKDAAVDSRHDVRFLGFVDKMHEVLQAADFVMSKPGGLIASEALASGTPMLILNPRPGMETQNAEYLLENGAAIKVHHQMLIPFQLTELLQNSERVAAMRSAAERVSAPDAAAKIAQYVLRHAKPAISSSTDSRNGASAAPAITEQQTLG